MNRKVRNVLPWLVGAGIWALAWATAPDSSLPVTIVPGTCTQTAALPAGTPESVARVPAPSDSDTVAHHAAPCIQVNRAGLKELMELPGVGETIAQRILDHRTQHGSFKKPADLLDVKGIGSAKLKKMSELVCFE